ncbi:DNA repair protein RecO [Candidatus Solincola sp.]|nr:DNA repair protein RecO [Actinomycetota bacterium]MDI7252152.1 DNA repair protein RecO [Actinomycetota bacterium]
MATLKDEAIVLHAHDLGEADRIVSLITAGHGLRRAVVKGVKRTASRFGARLEPFTHLKIVLHEGRNLDTVTQADTVHAHAPLRSDYEKYLCGEAMLELAERSLRENQAIPRFFDLLRVTLGVLEGEVRDCALLLAAYQLKACALIGYRPHLDRCLHCGREASTGSWRLDPSEGGIACAKCAGGSSRTFNLSTQGLELMRRLLGTEMAAVARFEEPPRLVLEALRVSFAYAESVLELRLRSRQIVLQHLEGKMRGAGPLANP